MIKHTPGPWEYKSQFAEHIYSADGEFHIAMSTQDSQTEKKIPINKANFKLIAAAPEMYEALKDACKNCVVCNHQVCESCKVYQVSQKLKVNA